MIQGKCPICRKSFQVSSLDEAPGFPFCSERCKLVDLGRWIDGDYAIPGRPEPIKQGPEGQDDDEED